MATSTLTLTPAELTFLRSLNPSDCESILKAKMGIPSTSNRIVSHREREARRRQQITREVQNIGPPAWQLIDHASRRRAAESLEFHLKHYHAETFSLPWAPFHLRFIKLAEHVVHTGGWFAFAVSRGFGKSKLAEGTAEWASLHGHKQWPVLIGATDSAAHDRLRNILLQLKENKRLLRDFPETCHPFRALGNEARRAKGQHIDGKITAIEVGQQEIVFPHVGKPANWPYKNTNGTRISAFGITAAFRGLSATTHDLKTIRPDLAVPDDPQTRESARSHAQSQVRTATILGDAAYLAGPGSPMSILMPCTVIYRGDMADTLLNRDLHPEFHGERHKMLDEMPDDMEAWDKYAEILRECQRQDKPIDEATEFYKTNRQAMDAGAVASWPERFDSHEISAIQHAMNLRIRDPESFSAEAQNEPHEDAQVDSVQCSTLEIMQKQHHMPRGVLPVWCEHVVAHIDIQQRMLYCSVAGGSPEFEVGIVDQFTVPEQKRTYFNYSDKLTTLQDLFSSETNLEAQLYRGIQLALQALATSAYSREDGTELKVELVLVDCGWQTATVMKACRESEFASIAMPMKGVNVRATHTPMAMRKKREGERKGHEWFIKPQPENKKARHVQANVNYWKTQLHTGFRTTAGPGSVSLWNDRPERHRMFADHCVAEVPQRVTSGENTVDEWLLKPHKPDNHFFDTAVGCLVGLSIRGCRLGHGHDDYPQPRRRRIIRQADVRKR